MLKIPFVRLTWNYKRLKGKLDPIFWHHIFIIRVVFVNAIIHFIRSPIIKTPMKLLYPAFSKVFHLLFCCHNDNFLYLLTSSGCTHYSDAISFMVLSSLSASIVNCALNFASVFLPAHWSASYFCLISLTPTFALVQFLGTTSRPPFRFAFL